MAENDEELLRKRISQQAKQRTGLALLFDPKCGDQQRKRNGRADIRVTKRMADSADPRASLSFVERRGEMRARRTRG